jgi:hypothetical protein
MNCDYSVTFKNRGKDANPGDEVVTYVAERLRGDAALAVLTSSQPPGVRGSIDADDPEAAHTVCEIASRSLVHLGLFGWNVECSAWPNVGKGETNAETV